MLLQRKLFRLLLLMLIVSFFVSMNSNADFSSRLYLNNNEKIAQINQPELQFDTFFGGSNYDSISLLKTDLNRNIILAGITTSADFPTLNAYDNSLGSFPYSDGFLAKFSYNGSLLFSTYIGGSDYDSISFLKIDSLGNIIIAGETSSANFPIQNAFDGQYDGSNHEMDSFLMKFSPSGILLFSTYIGGSKGDFIHSLSLDSLGNIVLAGYTTSADFPTLNAYDNVYHGTDYIYSYGDSFLMKFSPNGQLLFSTFLGGSEYDSISLLFLDSLNNIFLSGTTSSADFPTLTAFDDSYNGGGMYGDVFLAKFSSNGLLLFSSYIGGSGSDVVASLNLDSLGNIILSGTTSSANFPTLNAYDDTFGGSFVDVFVMKFSSTLQLLFSTYIGGSKGDSISFLNLDNEGNIILTGQTFSEDYPTLNSFNISFSGNDFSDVFITKFSVKGKVTFSGKIGGSSTDTVSSLKVDSLGNIVVSGTTNSLNFPVINTNNQSYGLGISDDGFLVKVSPSGQILFSSYIGGYGSDSITSLELDSVGNVVLAGETSSSIILTKNSFNDTYGGETDGFLVKINLAPDNDNDGINDEWEINYGLNNTINDSLSDLDQDGMPNIYEYQKGFNPTVNDANEDPDGDWITNLEEYHAGSDPLNVFSFPLLSFNLIYAIILIFILIICLLLFILKLIIHITRFKQKMKAPAIIIALLIWKGKFKNYQDFYQAKLKGASSQKEYDLVLKFKAPSYEIALEMEGGNFTEYNDYIFAKAVGASSIEEYQLVLKYHAPDYESAISTELGGFPSFDLFEKAREEGYLTFEDFLNKEQKID